MQNHTVYFIFHRQGNHKLPLNKTLKVEFQTWELCARFLNSGYIEKQGGRVLAIIGHKKSQINPVMKKELQKEIPNVDGAVVVELLYSSQGVQLRSAVNN
jgi:hypothetical protein